MTRHAIPMPEDLGWNEAVERSFAENLPYRVSGGRLVGPDAGALVVECDDHVPGADVHRSSLALLREIGANLRDASERVLREFTLPVHAHADPMIELRASGDVVVAGRGRLAYGGRVLRIVEALDACLAQFAATCDAVPQSHPTTVSHETLLRSGYLRAFPQHALFVAAAVRDAAKLSTIADHPRPPAGALADHDQVLAPTVCYHCFEALADSNIAPGLRFTASCACHRAEVLAADSLERLQSFRMREIVSFGSAAEMSGLLDQMLEWSERLLARWGVAHRVVVATDPFFAGAAGSRAFFQVAFELKRELQVRLDFSGRWLAVASFNNHQQSMTGAFGIRSPEGRLDSACAGWGLERLGYALLARHGCELSRWPEELRADLGV